MLCPFANRNSNVKFSHDCENPHPSNPSESSVKETEQSNSAITTAENKPTNFGTTVSTDSGSPVLNRIIKRIGGRHLIFRTRAGKWSVFPRPRALVSTFRGAVWFFYGIGQVWVTHKKYKEFDGWMSRVPRIWAPKLVALLDELEPALNEFAHHCNESGIEGTIVIETVAIEFHWTFGYPLENEKEKKEHSDMLDSQFQKLVDAYLAVTEKGKTVAS